MAEQAEELVTRALEGSRTALEQIIELIQDKVYALSLRMLFHPMDAEDATQEILVKVITNLRGFRFEGPFQAWVYRIAANHLKTTRKRRAEHKVFSLESAQANIDRAQARGWFSSPLEAPAPLLELEMRSACTQALLLTLDRDLRLAFILGVVIKVSGKEGAYILGITPEAFRKRLSRSRRRVTGFLQANCGLFSQANPCFCAGIAAGHVGQGWIDPQKPLFATAANPGEDQATLRDYMKELDDLGKLSAMFHAFPRTRSPQDFAAYIKEVLDSGEYRILEEPQIH